MTAKEARQLTKAALLNTPIMQNLDKGIAKAAKEGKFSVELDFIGSDGYRKWLTEVERDAMVGHYSALGFMAISKPLENGRYYNILIDWSGEIEETGGAIITGDNID